jgi:hypothetical protein
LVGPSTQCPPKQVTDGRHGKVKKTRQHAAVDSHLDSSVSILIFGSHDSLDVGRIIAITGRTGRCPTPRFRRTNTPPRWKRTHKSMKITNLDPLSRPVDFMTNKICMDHESRHWSPRVGREHLSHERRQWTALRALTEITSLGAFSTI